MSIAEAHEKATGVGTELWYWMGVQADPAVRDYLRAMEAAGFVMVPMEATEEMKKEATAAASNANAARAWRQMRTARPRLPS